MKLEPQKMNFLQKRQRDDVGEVFDYEGKILRGIYHEKAEMVQEFFSSGFVDDLILRGYFPKSFVTEFTSEKYAFIVEHERMVPVVYPQEWSFSMLRDAALMVVDVARVARKYGYNMKDCHGLNVLFDDGKPVFIDLGSFHNNPVGVAGWQPYKEFLRFYYYPLFMWKDGLEHLSKLSIFGGNLTAHEEYYIYKYRWLRYLGVNRLKKLLRVRFVLMDLNLANSEKLSGLPVNGVVKVLVSRLMLFSKYFYNNDRDLDVLKKRIEKLERPETATMWKEYHNNISKKKARFDRIVELFNEHCSGCNTAIDIAGNQGLFAKKILSDTGVDRIIVQDLDEQAIDTGYLSLKVREQGSAERVTYVNYNALAPIVKPTLPLPNHRFRSDVVFSLALFHHLILTQGYTLDHILSEIDSYSDKYVCVEFMPKGLWMYGAEVSVPGWYTIEWFREAFCSYFKLIVEEKVEENYILFIGAKIK